MSLTPLAIGAGARLGTWGLFQNKCILIVAEKIVSPATMQVSFYAPGGQLIYRAVSGRTKTEKLSVKWSIRKDGGMTSFSITIPRLSQIPFFSGMRAVFSYAGVKYFTGEVREYPESDSSNEIVQINGIGYSQRLKDIAVSQTFTSETVKDILTYFIYDLWQVGILFNPDKISNLSFTIDKISFTNKTLHDVVEQLKKIANYNYVNQQVVYGVDNERELYFKLIDVTNDTEAQLFEGTDYQSPDVAINTKDIINSVSVFRSVEGAKNTIEFVADYTDSDSVARYGLFNKKLVISDFVSTTQAENIANSIITELKDPVKTISVKNIVRNSPLECGYYKISNKRNGQSFNLSEFDTLSQWDLTSIGTSVVEVIDNNVFSGRHCFKWTVNNNANARIRLTFDKIMAPTLLRFYIKQEVNNPLLFNIAIIGGYGNNTFKLATTDGKLIVTDTVKNIKLHLPTGYIMSREPLNSSLIGYWLNFDIPVDDYQNITGIDIINADAGANVVYIDRLDVYANSYFQNTLPLRSADYEFNSTLLKASAVFGGQRESAVTEIESINKKTLASYDIFSNI